MDWLTFRGSGDFWFGSDDVKKDIKARIENFKDRPVRIYWGVVPVGQPSLVLLPVIGILAKACRHLNVEVDILIADIYAKSKGCRDHVNGTIEAFETFIEKWMMRLARSENYSIIRESDIAGKLSYIETVASVAGLCPGISVCDALQIADEVALSVDIQVGYPDQHEIFELARKIGKRQPTHMIIGWVGGKSSIITGPGNISRPNVIILAEKICMGISEKAVTGIIKKMSDSEVEELMRILPECFSIFHIGGDNRRDALIKKICEEFGVT